MLKSKPITSVKVNDLFSKFSLEYDYNPADYTHELASLISKWETQGSLEIYQTPKDREYGKIKPSDEDGRGKFVYQYCGLYHVRVTTTDNDPLVVIKFHTDEEDPNLEYVSLRFLSDHEQLFGTLDQKDHRGQLKIIRDRADDMVQEGSESENEET